MSTKQWGHGYYTGNLNGKYDGTIEELKAEMVSCLGHIHWQAMDILKMVSCAFIKDINEDIALGKFSEYPDCAFESLMASVHALNFFYRHQKSTYKKMIESREERKNID
jgi:hypothetical protein